MAGMLGYWYRLYMQMTPAEKALEPAIAALGERYRSQHPFLKHKLFADFALLDRQRIIEVDGASHDTPRQKYKDLQHMLALKADGWDVIRVSNDSATVAPEETVKAALVAIPQTVEQLEAARARLLRDYPELSVPPAKRSKSVKRRRTAKQAAGKRA